MTRNEHLIKILEEECCETAIRASKALRFGINEIQIDQDLTNAERIVYEFNDILAMMELLYDAGLIPQIMDREAIEKKKLKIEKFFIISREQGTLTD